MYALLKIPATIGFWLYARLLRVNNKNVLKLNGPILLACNHPNSFLDAIVLCSLFDQPIYSLARGDVFKNKWAAAFLRSVKILPVYRTSEGVENLEHNYTTFAACKEIFKQGGIVLIFSEGLCLNEWHLRPLKKGTARLAISSWNDGIPLTVMPTGINYSNFHHVIKNIHLLFGEAFGKEIIDSATTEGKAIATFNNRLKNELEQLVYEIAESDLELRKKIFEKPLPAWQKFLLAIPALLGHILHWPLYAPVKAFVQKRFLHSGHYDSIVVGLLFFLYPIYLILIFLITFLITKSWWSLLMLPLFPMLAWCRSKYADKVA